MNESEELFREIILDHAHNPRNFKPLEPHTQALEIKNPNCGDAYTLFLQVNSDILEQATFTGSGCSLSKAACSILTDNVQGLEIPKVTHYLESFLAEMKKSPDSFDPANVEDLLDRFGEAAALLPARNSANRLICATFAFDAMLKSFS